jgi:hypothetical protein
VVRVGVCPRWAESRASLKKYGRWPVTLGACMQLSASKRYQHRENMYVSTSVLLIIEIQLLVCDFLANGRRIGSEIQPDSNFSSAQGRFHLIRVVQVESISFGSARWYDHTR